MDRRAFLMLTLVGIADPGSSVPPASSTASPPPQPGAAPLLVSSIDTPFEAWMQDYMQRAVRAGLPADVVQREFAGLTPDPDVVGFDGRQAEFSKPIGDYVRGAVTEARLAMAQRRRAGLPHLADIEQRYGVPSEILISIWAMESGFGAVQGSKDVLRSLASLASAGRRRAWAEGQLDEVLRIIASGKAARAQLKGSWAGAMGQTQMEPSEYLHYAVDGDGDGRADIWGSPEDALASAAHLLEHYGWRRDEPWDREVILRPGFDYSLAEGPSQTPIDWAAIGAARADGAAWRGAESVLPAQLVLPAGADGPAFLIFPNHAVIRQYNNSIAYSLSVGLFADRLAGAGPLVTPWPHETPMSLADRLDAQNALAKLGYYTGSVDAMIGLNTRIALRAWQKARGLPADGHLTMDQLNRLRGEAANAAQTPPPAS
jgi:membrane-bound lytic murein transglycosylase B